MVSLTVCFLPQVLKSASQTETEDGIKSVVSVKVTSDITAFCNASNEHGYDALTFNIKASEFLLLLAFPVSALCVYMCVRLCLLSSMTPPLLFLPFLSVSLFCLFLLRLKASSSAMCRNVLPVSVAISVSVVVSDGALRSCAAVKCAPLLPQCVNRECPPFCAFTCFQLYTPPHQPPPPLPLQLPLSFPLPQVRPQSLCTAHQAPLKSNQLQKV